MSIYLLSRATGPDAAASKGIERFRQMATAQGFHPLPPRRFGEWVLDLIETPSRTGIISVESEPGSLLLAAGLFLYRGLSGVEALRACGEAMASGRFDRRDTQGHFTLLRCGADGIEVFCDGLGAHKIYHLAEKQLYSNSFLAALCCIDKGHVDPVGAHVYAFAGACYGGRTFIRELRFFGADRRLHLGKKETVSQIAPLIRHDPVAGFHSFDEALHANLGALRAALTPLVTFSQGRIRLSFSGGYDSRLLLALLLEQGVLPELYVYGADRDIDVRIAKHVAEAEGLKLRHVDKGKDPTPDGEAFRAVVEAGLVHFDGWKNTGLFDNGADVPDRRSRHQDGYLPVNGGLGEIYRNFFSLRDRAYRTEDIVASFYSGFDPRWIRDRSAIPAYCDEMALRMREQLDTGTGRLTSLQAQLLYPLFRGRFWTAREAEINQRFGAMAFPFLEHRLIDTAAQVPVPFKDYGRLQAALITALSPRLAALPTGYGFGFDSPPGWRYRLDTWSTLMRPIWLRRHIRIFRRRRQGWHRPPWLAEERLRTVMDPSLPFMRDLFAIEQVNDADTLNRIVTMDYLAQRFDLRD
ncbi:MAG: hypothetical protein ACE5ED_11915 [Rhodothalassiaceae bacterium]